MCGVAHAHYKFLSGNPYTLLYIFNKCNGGDIEVWNLWKLEEGMSKISINEQGIREVEGDSFIFLFHFQTGNSWSF